MKAKVIRLPDEKFQNRLSLQTCKQILRAKENGYSDEEVFTIRDTLCALADIDYEYFQATKEEAKVIELNINPPNETKSHSIHPRKHHEQAEKGYSLKHQQERLERYCEFHSIDVIATYQDDHSAKTFERPQFQNLLASLKKRRETPKPSSFYQMGPVLS